MNDARRPRTPFFFWLTLLATAVYVGFFSFAVFSTVRHFGISKAPGWSASASRAGWFVSAVNPSGPAAGRVEVGDWLLAINGDERSAVLGAFRLRDVSPGETYAVELERRGAPIRVDLALATAPASPLASTLLVCSLAFFVCGAGLGFLRPADPQVRMLAASFFLVATGMLVDTLWNARSYFVGWERAMYLALACTSIWPFPMSYHFFSRFPRWSSPGPAWRAVQWLLYAACLFVFWPAWVVAQVGASGVSEAITEFLAARPALYLAAAIVVSRAVFFFIPLSLLLALVVTAYNYRRLEDADSRRRIRWVVAGLVAPSVPFIVVMFAYWVMGWVSAEAYRVLYSLATLVMIGMPASVVAAVWQDQLFDIRVLVRRGLQYLLARTALRLLLALPIAVLLISIVSDPNRTITQILFEGSGWFNLISIGAIAVAIQYRPRLQAGLDRRFFREAYEQEQVLLRLIEEIRAGHSMADLARLISARIDSVFHPTSLHLFYRAQERSELVAGHSSTGTLMGHRLPERRALVEIIERAKAIQDVPSRLIDALPAEERRWLEDLGVRLIVPITGSNDRLVGLLMLGERRSDEPYSTTDRRLLQGIAAQIGLVYENQHLQDRVRSDADTRRDVLARLDQQQVSLLKECPICGICYDGSATRCDRDQAELVLPLPVERTLDGKYRLDRALGRGGMGAVYEATDLRLQRVVAAKVMVGSLFGDQQAIRRFEREARAAARIDHVNITRVHDYGSIGSMGAYLIMELVAGRTWRAELVRAGRIAPARSVDWFRQLLEGLRVAHEAGIIHRDLKPENVMIVPQADGAVVKIMDFGLAKLDDAGTGVTEALSVAGHAMGTIGYMAPEALSGGPVDVRADIFAIGVMVVETITGARPFAGRTPQEVITALLQSSYRLPGESPELRALDAVLQRCLAKAPGDRYGSVAALATDLLPALHACGAIADALSVDTTPIDSRAQLETS